MSGDNIEDDIEDIYALSPAQKGLLFHALAAPDSPAYRNQLSCTLYGALDLEKFLAAWQVLVDRHTTLRTAFDWRGLEEPVQIVLRRAPLAADADDWRAFARTEQQEKLKAVLHDDLATPFDLSRPPLMRLKLIRRAEQEHHLVWTQHHLIFDGWSTAILLQEVFAVYHGLLTGRGHELKPVRPFKDYVAWLERQPVAEAEAFWLRNLAGFRAATDLGLHQRPLPVAAVGHPPGHLDFGTEVATLSVDETNALHEFARRGRITLGTIMQAAWAVLLSRTSGETDVVFGLAMSGRSPSLVGADRMVGMFVNTVPARIVVSPHQRVGEWLADLQRKQAELFAFEFISLQEIQRLIGVPGNMALFDTVLIFENFPVDRFREGGTGLQIANVAAARYTNIPIAVTITPAKPLSISVDYDSSRFNAAAIQRLVQQFRVLLSRLVADRDRRVKDLPILPEAERHQIVVRWNDTAAAIPQGCVDEILAAQAKRQPNAVAVVHGERHLTYAELERRANGAAWFLRGRGVGPDVVVALLMPRSIDVLIAMLAVFKAGGAYLPLDPDNPMQRNLQLLEQGGVTRVIATRQLGAALSSEAQATASEHPLDIFQIERLAEHNETTGPMPWPRTPRQLAYVIYTSGSTGVPKGVAIEHRSVVNLLRAMEVSLGLTSNDVMLASTPLTFDIAGLELLLPLFVGARVAIAPEGAATDVTYLRRFIADGGITAMQATPVTWRLLVDSGWLPPTWLKILCGGEALPSRLAAELVSAAGRMWNLYGPTETTIWSTLKRLDRAHQQVTIGRAIANTQTYIVDAALRPMPAGAVADLYIAGDGLARGYLGRPKETAESYRPNPFSRDAGARMYRTSDLARYLADGDIEFRGRSDHQVKIRGIRIETDAISAVLTTHPSIRESVTVVVEDAVRGAHLAAYIVLGDGASLSHRELRSYLRRHLPAYMIPSAFVEFDELPRTPSNKIDRKALPAPNETNYRQVGEIVPARSPIEQAIAAIWRDVLLLKDLGVHDDFFELGGNSLQATRLLLRMNERPDMNISMKEFLDAPSIAGLVARLGEQKIGAGSPPPRIEPLPRGRYFSLAPQQEGWLEQELRTGRLYPNHIQLPIRLAGALDFVNLEQAVQAAERRHEALRTSFRIQEDRCVQMIANECVMRVPIVDLSGLPADLREAQISRIVRTDIKRPFDLRRAPLFRLHCLRVAAAEHVLVLSAQHLVCDGWSIEVLTADVTDIYCAQARGEFVRLPPLPIQYVDFADWQRRWLQTPDFTPHLAYWLRQLTPPPAPLFRHTDGSADDFAVGRLRLRVPGSIFEPVKRRGRELGCSLFTAVVAALTFALHRDAGETDVAIGTMAANRSQTHTGNVVGLFTNPIVVRTDIEDAASVREILLQVREVVKEAFIHQELPFDAIVHALERTRRYRRSDLFQVMMVWQAAAEKVPTLPGIHWRSCPIAEDVQGIETVPSTIELFFTMSDGIDHLGCEVAYKIRHFAPERVQAIFADFADFLERLAIDPDMPASKPIFAAPQAGAADAVAAQR